MVEKEITTEPKGENVTVAPTETVTESTTKTVKPQDTPVVSTETVTATAPSPRVCDHCGASITPERIETPVGVSLRCPKCNKWLSQKKPRAIQVPEKGPLPPYEVMLTDRVKELLAANLTRVHGIPKKETAKTIMAILDTLNPEAASDPWNLHNHVKNFAPNADDRHLESIIKKIFGQLEVEGYVTRGRRRYRPSYDRRRGRREEYIPSYAREERDEEEDEYEGRRRRRRMTIVVEGQEIETDFQGYMAYQTWKREQEEHDLRKKRLEAEILKITRETGGSRTPQGSYEEVREFIDAKGNLCDPEKAVSVRVRRVPVGTGSTEIKELREEMRKLERTVRDRELSQLREEIKGLKEKPRESEEVKTLRGELNESRKAIEDLKSTIETKDRQALLDKVGGLEKRLSDLAATGTGEWKSDEIRLIKGGISDIKDLLQTYLTGERPLDRAERILVGQPGVPPPSEAGPETQPRLEELRKQGLVVRLVDRARRR